MPELLLEVGCEELPASFVEKAFHQLRDEVVERLDESNLAHGSARCYGTPRRLIVVVEDVAVRQPDSEKEQRGPRISAAFDASGNPTPALIGFCKGNDVQPDQVRQEGEYVWVTKQIVGRPAAEVLSELLPESIRALNFEKSMRWGEGRMRFARPIRWIVALLGGSVVPFDIEGVASDSYTCGKRVLGAPLLIEAGKMLEFPLIQRISVSQETDTIDIHLYVPENTLSDIARVAICSGGKELSSATIAGGVTGYCYAAQLVDMPSEQFNVIVKITTPPGSGVMRIGNVSAAAATHGRPEQLWYPACCGCIFALKDGNPVHADRICENHKHLQNFDLSLHVNCIYAELEKMVPSGQQRSLVRDFTSLSTTLRESRVEFDGTVRKRMIEEAALAIDPGVDLDEANVDENVYLTEWPMPSLGTFDEEYLALPPDVLIVAMKKHEKFLPIRDADGKITNRFVSVRNGGDEETVIWGNQWVLGARFADAKFFFDDDSKHPLSWFAERLDRIVFQEKLGTLADKTGRLIGLCDKVASSLGLSDEERRLARRSAELAKADLASGLVVELPALQGIVGGEYARRDGEVDEVCWAIRTHYHPTEPPACLGAKLARILMAADRVDTLCGYLGLGLVPSGSSDPFGLRRAVHMLILNGQAFGSDQSFPPIGMMLSWACAEYGEQGHDFAQDAIRRAMAELALGRYDVLYEGARKDLLEAVLGAGWDDAWRVAARLELLTELSKKPDFVDVARTSMRAGNIAAAAVKKGIAAGGVPSPEDIAGALASVDVGLMELDEERKLHSVVIGIESFFSDSCRKGDYHPAFAQLHEELAGPIGAYFDKVMVMVDDEKIRDNRLRLLAAIAGMYIRIADFSKIVIEG